MMNNLKINSDILFATDKNGVAVFNKNSGSHIFIKYPEAAVWSVLIENHGMVKSDRMLEAILCKRETDADQFINKCLAEWKHLNLIQ